MAKPPARPDRDPADVASERLRTLLLANLVLNNDLGLPGLSGDDDLVSALASATAALDNGRLYDEARRGQKWLRASAEITRQLLADDDTDPMALIVETAQELADADLISVVLPAPGNRLRTAFAVGNGADHFRGTVFEPEQTEMGRAMARGETMLVDALANVSAPGYENPYQLGPMIIAPLVDAKRIRGALLLMRTVDRPLFTQSELELAATFANHVALALDLADTRADAELVSLLEERERIARDLHDLVIQRLFAIGLGLQGLATSVGDTEVVSRRLGGYVTDLDETIAQIRATIFDLTKLNRPDAGRRARDSGGAS